MLSLTPQPQPLLMPPNDWAEGKYHLQDRMPVTKDMHDTLASMIAQMNKVGSWWKCGGGCCRHCNWAICAAVSIVSNLQIVAAHSPHTFIMCAIMLASL